jgi:DNA-binding HxlR family transcriptional regulator
LLNIRLNQHHKWEVETCYYLDVIISIALKVLSRHLKELEADGIINRKVYAEVPPKVEYTLTEKGMSLNDVMQLLAEWGKKNNVAE